VKKLIAILFCASLFILGGCDVDDNTDITDPLNTNQTTNGGTTNNNQ
jgi:hypothetical protein